MLDRLPEDYEGWLIRTDYRIGVQIQLCISDPELSDSEKTGTALYLLYGNGVPDLKTALDGLTWFMCCGNPTKEEIADDGPPVFSFEEDAGRIVSAFKKVFGIDISREKLHWFEFIPMLHDLSGTAHADVITIRTADISDVDQKRRAEFIRMKNRFALSTQYTQEEQAEIDEFMSRLQ